MLRSEAPHVVSALARRFGHFDAAEDAAQEALLAASLQWPAEGVPDSPRSWLIRVGYRRMVDALRAEQAQRQRDDEYVFNDPRLVQGDVEASTSIDDSLNLLLLCCHPSLSPTSQVALTLRAVGGLTTVEIAHAYGVTEQTMGVRISRAKQQLKTKGARFEFSGSAEELSGRVASVMRVLYLIFNEGYVATSGARLVRTDLSSEAIRLSRMLLERVPDNAEAAGLVALMLLHESRRPARLAGDNGLIVLADQDRSLWNRAMIEEGVALIERVWTRGPIGRYQLQAAIAAVHADAPTAEATDWPQIAGLYLALEQVEPGGPVFLARIVAVAHAFGEPEALALFEELDAEHGMTRQPLTAQRAHAVKAHLLARGGDVDEARSAFLDAAELTTNEIEARYLREQADDPGA